MPLSEHEQRILAELEDSLSKQDPRFAKSVRETNVYSHGGRRVRWGILGFVAGPRDPDPLLLVAASPLGLVGVALMFVSAVVIERNARLLGRASWQDITRSGPGRRHPRERRSPDPLASRLVVASAPQEGMTAGRGGAERRPVPGPRHRRDQGRGGRSSTRAARCAHARRARRSPTSRDLLDRRRSARRVAVAAAERVGARRRGVRRADERPRRARLAAQHPGVARRGAARRARRARSACEVARRRATRARSRWPRAASARRAACASYLVDGRLDRRRRRRSSSTAVCSTARRATPGTSGTSPSSRRRRGVRLRQPRLPGGRGVGLRAIAAVTGRRPAQADAATRERTRAPGRPRGRDPGRGAGLHALLHRGLGRARLRRRVLRRWPTTRRARSRAWTTRATCEIEPDRARRRRRPPGRGAGRRGAGARERVRPRARRLPPGAPARRVASWRARRGGCAATAGGAGPRSCRVRRRAVLATFGSRPRSATGSADPARRRRRPRAGRGVAGREVGSSREPGPPAQRDVRAAPAGQRAPRRRADARRARRAHRHPRAPGAVPQRDGGGPDPGDRAPARHGASCRRACGPRR